MPQPLRVIHNHLGFRPRHGRKWVLVPDTPEAVTVFGSPVATVKEQNQFSMHPLNHPDQHAYTHHTALKRVRDDFGSWLVGDFSEIQGPGIYQAHCAGEMGPSFAVRDDVWCRVLPECIRYFQVQSCGRRVPGWHEACHLDDGYIVEKDRYVDAAGGWHDAGDYRKWASSTAMIAMSLLMANRMWGGREDDLGLERGIFLQESMQGVHFFLNIQQSDGSLLHNIGGGARTFHDNEDCRFTDNVKRSGDERRIHPGAAKPAGKFTTLYAMYANEWRQRDPDLAARCAAAARASDAFDQQVGSMTAEALAWRAFGRLELWRYHGEDADRDAGVSTLDELVNLQVMDYIGGQNAIRGFFRRSAEPEAGYDRKHVGASWPIIVAAAYLEALPKHHDAGRWRDAIALWTEDFVKFFVDRNPFGLLPYGLYEKPSREHPYHHYRPLGDRLCYRYFLADRHGMSNARFSLDALALSEAAKTLDRSELTDHAYRLLEWTLGNNPFQASTMTGFGFNQPSALSFQMGNIPGGVTLGIGGDEHDLPVYDRPWSCWDEYYGYQTSQFLWATLSLQTIA